MPNKLPENTFVHLNSDGLVEVVDIFTGRVIAIQKSREALLFGDSESLTRHGEIFIEKTLGETPKINHYQYSPLQAAAICHHIAEGKSMLEISKMEGFPPMQVIRHWRKQFDDFEALLNLAKKDRAEFYQHEAILVARNTHSKDDASAAKVKLDAYRWAASTDDPDTFGNKTKISGDPSSPLTLMIDTGIRRIEDVPREEIPQPVPSLPIPVAPSVLPDTIEKDGTGTDSIREDKRVSAEEVSSSGEFPYKF